MLPFAGEEKAPFALATNALPQGRPAFAPNGKFVAYPSDETGREESYVQSFPSTGRRWPVSSSGGGGPRWSPDGREILYINAAGELVSTGVETDVTEIRVGASRVLFLTFRRTRSLADSFFDISADGEPLVFTRPAQAPAPLTAAQLGTSPPEVAPRAPPFSGRRCKRLDADTLRYR